MSNKPILILIITVAAVIKHFIADETKGNNRETLETRRPPLPIPSAFRRHYQFARPQAQFGDHLAPPLNKLNEETAYGVGGGGVTNLVTVTTPTAPDFGRQPPSPSNAFSNVVSPQPQAFQPQQQSFAVQGVPVANEPSGYGQAEQPGTTEDYKPHPAPNRQARLHRKPAPQASRAKRRCPRQASALVALVTDAQHQQHRVVGQISGGGTEYAGGPNERVLTHGAASYSRARGPEYARVVTPPARGRVRPKARRPAQGPAAGPAAAEEANSYGENQQGGNGRNQWAFIAAKQQKKPAGRKNGGRPRLLPAGVTPAPGGTEIGGFGHFFTTLPPGVKGIHYPHVDSNYIPQVKEAHPYYYPPRMPLPLPTCFHNPTGYPCCNPALNDLMVETYTELESKPKFHTCNINAIAQHLQIRAEERFNTSFETVAAFDDFAQKIHFYGDLVCKVELGGKYMLAYGTVKDVQSVLAPEGSLSRQGLGGTEGGLGGGSTSPARREKREDTFVGPRLPPPLNDLSRRHTMWI